MTREASATPLLTLAMHITHSKLIVRFLPYSNPTKYWFGLLLPLLTAITLAQPDVPPTLADFWDGRAEWVIDRRDVGLPVGESDTIRLPDGTYWSYLHASAQSAGVVDSCGQPVSFPGCTTLWQSTNNGDTFAMTAPVCLVPCGSCPCTDDRDHITAQQYPRVDVVRDESGNIETAYMVYEWHAQTRLRTSSDGLNWSPGIALRFPSGTWPTSFQPCRPVEAIGPHPNIDGQADGCLVGAPPGIYIEDDTLYIFVAAGSAPGHMRCYKGDRFAVEADPLTMQRCDTDPLFEGAAEYGPDDLRGPDANPYFDFRYVSSAEVLRVGDQYYMAYEGIRGPDVLNRGWDTQFALGFARTTEGRIDGPWEKWPGNPALMPVSPNFGVGHADLMVINGETIMITATSMNTRGRYILQWSDD
ncbi:MAG: hypothetical protein AAF125_03105 [Chloroflexota bacterium]